MSRPFKYPSIAVEEHKQSEYVSCLSDDRPNVLAAIEFIDMFVCSSKMFSSIAIMIDFRINVGFVKEVETDDPRTTNSRQWKAGHYHT